MARLMEAIWRGRVKAVQQMLDEGRHDGVGTFAYNRMEYTALHVALLVGLNVVIPDGSLRVDTDWRACSCDAVGPTGRQWPRNKCAACHGCHPFACRLLPCCLGSGLPSLGTVARSIPSKADYLQIALRLIKSGLVDLDAPIIHCTYTTEWITNTPAPDLRAVPGNVAATFPSLYGITALELCTRYHTRHAAPIVHALITALFKAEAGIARRVGRSPLPPWTISTPFTELCLHLNPRTSWAMFPYYGSANWFTYDVARLLLRHAYEITEDDIAAALLTFKFEFAEFCVNHSTVLHAQRIGDVFISVRRDPHVETHLYNMAMAFLAIYNLLPDADPGPLLFNNNLPTNNAEIRMLFAIDHKNFDIDQLGWWRLLDYMPECVRWFVAAVNLGRCIPAPVVKRHRLTNLRAMKLVDPTGAACRGYTKHNTALVKFINLKWHPSTHRRFPRAHRHTIWLIFACMHRRKELPQEIVEFISSFILRPHIRINK